MKRKAVLSTFFGLFSLAVSLAILFPLMGMKGFTFASSKSFRLDTNPPVTYYGGPVMPGVTNVYAIFWFPGVHSDMGTYISLIERYYQDVSGNRLYNMLSQYAGKNGTPSSTILRGTWVDTAKQYPAQITLQDLINEIKRAIATQIGPTGAITTFSPSTRFQVRIWSPV